MPGHGSIYQSQADRYDRLVSCEDYQGNIIRSLNRIVPLAGADVVELGAGTGRLTRLLVPVVRRVCAFDVSPHMLKTAVATLQEMGHNWEVAIADHRHLPVKDETADLVLSGWTICYLVTDHETRWQTEVAQALREMKRVLCPEG